MKFLVISDLHYISPKVIIDDKNATISSACSLQALKDAQDRDDIDTILLTGDLTDRGDKPSHDELLGMLREMKAKGKKIFVLTATHDFNHHRACTRMRGDTKANFTAKPWELPYFVPEETDFRAILKPEFAELSDEEITPKFLDVYTPLELWDLYREFGRDEAYSVDNEGYSYCIDLDDDTRCLMLHDSFRNEEALSDNSPTYPPATLRWIRQMKKEADRDGKFLFICTHHPLVPPSPAYRIGAGNRNMRSEYSVHTLADMGINLAITGHTHFADVGFGKSPEGNTLCDITTPSVRAYPPRYRIIDLDGKNGKIKYECITISQPDVDTDGLPIEEYLRTQLKNEYLGKMLKLQKPLNKIVTEMRVKDFYFICKNAAKLTNEEFDSVKDIKFFDLIIDTVFNMLSGDGKFTPETPEYKLLMGLAATLDSIIDAQPFVNLRKKLLKGYSVRDVIEPLCYNASVPDNNGEIDFTKMPEFDQSARISSNAGDLVMLIVCILAIPISKILPYVAVVGLPAMTLAKKIKLKKNPPKDGYKY